jgi:phosphonate transport system ATP-binding protein
VTHRFAGQPGWVLDIADLQVRQGERIALIGASGAGKTTLLTLIDGRLRGWGGEAWVLGHRLRPNAAPPRAQRRETGFVFQEYALVEPASVRQNVLNGRLGRAHPLWSLAGHFAGEDAAAAMRAMADVGIADLAERRVDRLSGGQRQRVAIARCLAQDPRLILADEPVGNLDPANAEAILARLADHAKTHGATLIVSSHQPRLAAPFVDRFVALDRGRIAFDGPPDALKDVELRSIYDEAARRQPEAA